MAKASTSPASPPPHRLLWWVELWLLLRRAARELAANDPLRLGAATAFFTSFALPPILIILVQLLGSVYSARGARMMLLTKLGEVIGSTATGLVAQTVHNVGHAASNRLITWLGFAFLVFIATTLFTVIQHSLNQLWHVRPRRQLSSVSVAARERLRSAGVLLATAALSVLAFSADAVLSLFANFASGFDVIFAFYAVWVLNLVVSLLILAVWCGFVFRTLSSAKVPWRAVRRGALLTAILIELGERVLSQLLVSRDLGPIYGPAASSVLVLLFVFYSAMIFYFGAAFTKVYAHHVGLDIKPKKTAVRYRLVNVEE
ncbi:YihY/virulence factor BrkB family protein [Hymenobacter sp. H14-R3]|uniref:YihY/virulence factor BrkB family protein n=1 Tax=Hymenobacter sp. H14-R3 TaxID=3046308 RepID=UPI0024BB8F96|nr:YihY/virulence factor BrkB family protein [Hymenobacter sp. H14-R3]MDJ0367021.1 YihY/virulence factor BrkB family protein [Hymenobacter sp. H14-R3]